MNFSFSVLKPQTRNVLGKLISRGERGISQGEATNMRLAKNLRARIAELRFNGVMVYNVPLKRGNGFRYVIGDA